VDPVQHVSNTTTRRRAEKTYSTVHFRAYSLRHSTQHWVLCVVITVHTVEGKERGIRYITVGVYYSLVVLYRTSTVLYSRTTTL